MVVSVVSTRLVKVVNSPTLSLVASKTAQCCLSPWKTERHLFGDPCRWPLASAEPGRSPAHPQIHTQRVAACILEAYPASVPWCTESAYCWSVVCVYVHVHVCVCERERKSKREREREREEMRSQIYAKSHWFQTGVISSTIPVHQWCWAPAPVSWQCPGILATSTSLWSGWGPQSSRKACQCWRRRPWEPWSHREGWSLRLP